MGKASLLTPVYFFSSIRAGSGKSSMLAHLAVYLNNVNQKVAIVDLDTDTPLKLKNSFPRSINLQEYSDISLISQNQDSRYQKNFYFTETNLISYFPAHQLKDLSMLFSDTTLRDFFIQITACFDTVMVNFPAGPLHCQKASELLARQHLWRGKSPIAIIVSQSDEKSLVSLDSLIHENPAFYYQLQENALLLFNRVPTSVEDQKLAENTLNSLELRSLFNFPATYVVGISEEFPHQRQIAAPLVLNPDSAMHQTISSLQRLLSSTARNFSRSLYEHTSDYQACLDGQLLEKLSPYLEKIQISAACKLFQRPSDVQVFLEENDGNYRVRIRLTGVRQPVSGIQRTIEICADRKIRDRLSPAIWAYRREFNIPVQVELSAKKEQTTLSVKPVYRFDDRFAESVDFKLLCDFDFRPNQSRYPSPIFFKPDLEMSEIPSLSEVLGYSRKHFKRCSFAICPQLYIIPGVTHFFIPPEFDLASTYQCIFEQTYIAGVKFANRWTLQHSKVLAPTYQPWERELALETNFPDVFARNQRLEPEQAFSPETGVQIVHEFSKTPVKTVKVRHSEPILARGNYLIHGFERPEISKNAVPPIIAINASVKIDPLPFPALVVYSRNHEWPDRFSLSNFTNKISAYCAWNCNLEMLLTSYNSASTDQFRFSFGSKLEEYRTALFPKTAISSPAEFSIENDAPAKEIYLQPSELVLPPGFRFADVLIDHFFAPTVYKLTHKCALFDKTTSRVYSPGHQIFFKQELKTCINTRPIKAIEFYRQNLEHRFSSAGYDYQNLPYRQRKEQPAMYHQVLQAAYPLPQMNFYRDISAREAVRTNIILDAKPNWRNLPPDKGKITELKVLLSRPPALSMSLAHKPAKPAPVLTLAKCILRQISNKKLPEKLSTAISPHFSQIITGANSNKMLRIASYYRYSGWHRAPANPIFCILEPELYTMPVRTGSRQIYHSVSAEIKDRIDIETMIENKTFEHQTIYSEKFISPQFFYKIFEHIMCPLRSRNIEFPQSMEFGDALSLKKALDHESKITNNIDNSFSAEFGVHRPVARPTYLPITLARQPLPKSASKTWKTLSLRPKQFRAVFPNQIETLYRHLLWSIATKRQQPVTFSKSFLSRSEGIAIPFKTDNSETAKQNTFCDKNYSVVNKLSLQILRSSIRVGKLSRKDILNLARQTTEKFNQFSNQLRA
ncbi:MAG: ParA family protein [Candidatus Riflebacteria bacterium]|nr:ParA family protein [Candidatus Riflebacteria bacterium]